MGFPKNSTTLFSEKTKGSPSSQIKDTKIPVKTQNAILHLLVEVNDAIHAPFLFLGTWLEITSKTLLVGYIFTKFQR